MPMILITEPLSIDFWIESMKGQYTRIKNRLEFLEVLKYAAAGKATRYGQELLLKYGVYTKLTFADPAHQNLTEYGEALMKWATEGGYEPMPPKWHEGMGS